MPAEEKDVFRLVELAAQVLGPVTVLTAALYYFGYIRYQAFFGYFGVDLASAGISRDGFLIGSARSTFRPLVVVLLTCLALLVAHYVLSPRLTRLAPRTRRILLVGVGGGALLLAAAAIAGLVEVTALGSPIIPPLSLAGAALLTGYATHLADAGELPTGVREALRQTRTVRVIVLAGLVLVAIFWSVAGYAQQRGRIAAEAFERSLPTQSRAIVYSREPLLITGRGVVVDKLPGPKAKYAYRYSGLRVLAHTGDRWLLVPAGWQRTESTVTILPDPAEDLRVDLAP